MVCDFDEIIDRKNTNSLKYDFAKERKMPLDLLPLWVADMDFRTPKEVIGALVEKSKHGIFGYSEVKEDYLKVLKNWYGKNFDWQIEDEWLVKTPGVVFAICLAIRALTEKGDSVLIQRPVYYPFSSSILDNDRVLINNPLIYSNGKYSIDFEDFENKIIENDVKLFILCNPHNPVGRVWTKEELVKLGDICLKHKVRVVSDEIHSDFVYGKYKHTVFASIKPEISDITITCTSPSKTFNLAGLQISNIFIKNKEIRNKFIREINIIGYSQLNVMGIVACKAAYENGSEWLQELKTYLEENIDFVRSFLKEKLPGVKLVEPEGTYLLWLDFKELGFKNDDLENLIINKAKLWLDGGTMFGIEGEGFQRINIACPRSVLEKALLNLKEAIDNVVIEGRKLK